MLVDFLPAFAGFSVFASGAAQVDGELAHFGGRVRFLGVVEETSNIYYDSLLDRAYLLVPAQAFVANFLKTFHEYSPRQKAASFTLDQVMQKMLQPQHN